MRSQPRITLNGEGRTNVWKQGLLFLISDHARPEAWRSDRGSTYSFKKCCAPQSCHICAACVLGLSHVFLSHPNVITPLGE